MSRSCLYKLVDMAHARADSGQTLIRLLAPADVPPEARAEVRKMMLARGMKSAFVEALMGALVAPADGEVVVEHGETEGGVPRVLVSCFGG